MDQVEIIVQEVAETVLIETQETIDQVVVDITEGGTTSIDVFETIEAVDILVSDLAETVLIEVTEGGPGDGGATTPYKRWTMPGVVDLTYGITAYTGFSEDLNADISEAKWAVKRVREDETEAWAGKTTFDQILDDYLTLTYT